MEDLEGRNYSTALNKSIQLMDTLENELGKILTEIKYLSQLKLFVKIS